MEFNTLYFYGVYISFLLNFLFLSNNLRLNKEKKSKYYNTIRGNEIMEHVILHYIMTFLSWVGIIIILFSFILTFKGKVKK